MNGSGSEGVRPRRHAADVVELPPPEPDDRQRLLAARHEAVELGRLLELVVRGDEHALAELYDRTSDRVYGLTLRVLRSPEQAAEVTEDTFADVWQQAGRYHPDHGSVFAWIVTIAHRRAVERVRGSSSRAPADEHANQAVSREIDEVWSVIAQALGTSRARTGIKAMTQVERQALLLAYFESLDRLQVAEHLDVSVDTVTTEMREGLRNLRRALGGGSDD